MLLENVLKSMSIAAGCTSNGCEESHRTEGRSNQEEATNVSTAQRSARATGGAAEAKSSYHGIGMRQEVA